jgi:hypothetical protein
MSNPHNHRSVPGRRPSSGSSSQRNAQLPAFCRTRSPRSLLVSVSSLRSTQRLLLLVLLFQLSTLLVVLGLLPDVQQPHLRSSAPHPLQKARVLP